MNNSCREWRELLLAAATKETPRTSALTAHLKSCAACSAALARFESHIAAMSRLAPRTAPRELDGLVVAAMQAGFRQDRAVTALSNLSRQAMPSDIRPEFHAPKIEPAPRDLDRRVIGELEDPKRAIARRLVGQLERQDVPRTLEERLAVMAGRLPSEVRRARDRRRALAFAGSVALVLVGIVSILSFVGRGQVEAREPRIVIERVNSPANMDPVVQATFAMVSGGVLDAKHVTREKL